MDRRSILRQISLITGAALVGGEMLWLQSCKPDSAIKKGNAFANSDIAVLDYIGETILPAPSGSFGPKDIGIGQFISKMVTDCYEEKDKKVFDAGLEDIKKRCQDIFKNSFDKVSDDQRFQLLSTIDGERKEYNKTKKQEDPEHYMTMFRQLTLLGFCTSERACKEVFNYVPVPSKYDGSYPYKKGDRVSM
jgi:hypothetical protein